MSASRQTAPDVDVEIVGEGTPEENAVAAIDPATILAFTQVAVSVATFIGQLVGGKTGSALTDAANAINGLGQTLLTIANDTQKILNQVDAAITSIDQLALADLAGVHTQLTGYIGSFPNGVPQNADVNNINYALAQNNTAKALNYFQNIGNRGPVAFMPSLCHATNSRLELAVSAWPCWYVQNSPAQPDFNQQTNVSHGLLSSNISTTVPKVRDLIRVKQLMKKLDPDLPPETIGWQVLDTGKVVWTSMNPDAAGAAFNERNKRQSEKVQSVLGKFMLTRDHWTNMTARFASAGIARALEIGDGSTFVRYVNPSALLMEEPAENARLLGADGTMPVYRPLPMRDILLDLLTSDAMRARHGLLLKSADRRAVSNWFEKTFFRRPSPTELAALVQVSELFGSGALFGCLAWSDEYQTRFGDGLPGPVDRQPAATTAVLGG